MRSINYVCGTETAVEANNGNSVRLKKSYESVSSETGIVAGASRVKRYIRWSSWGLAVGVGAALTVKMLLAAAAVYYQLTHTPDPCCLTIIYLPV